MSSSASKMIIRRKQHLPIPPTDDAVVRHLLRLMRIRDFLRLILSYPMRIGNETYLKEWISAVSKFSAKYSEQIAIFSTADDDDDIVNMPFFDSFWREVEILLSEIPLRYVGGLIPQNIIRDITNGVTLRLSFSESKSQELSATTTKETQLNQQVPQPILDLAAHLAVQQLAQTLTEHNKASVLEYNIHYVMFSTRNHAETQTAVQKIKAAFEMLSHWKVLVLDVSKNQIMGTKLETEDDDIVLLASQRSKMVMGRGSCLILVVYGDGDKKLEPWKARFPKRRGSADVVVFITTESSASPSDELTMQVDLVIRIEDHVLPWEVFCKNVGSELVHSSGDIQRIAVQIVEKSSGNLLAMLIVAKSLQNVEDVQLWELALEKLYHPNLSYKLWSNVNVLINAFINIIWVDAIFESKKPHLVKCLSVFKSQDLMMDDDEVFDNWFSEHLVKSEEEAEQILRELVERSILLEFEDNQGRHILLPKDINDILKALLKKRGFQLTEQPKAWNWHGAAKIQLMHNKISELPQSPNCPRLKELYLHGNANLIEIPTLFFQHMPMLQVLDLSYTGIRGLPRSMFKQAQLKTVYLRGCKQFKQLPLEIVLLENLEKLDLDGTPIEDLPLTLKFPKMRSLSLGGNPDLMEIPPSFFEHMPLLNILDLSCTSIHHLPSSFFNLKELREFYLRDCELFMELPPEIGLLRNMKKLELDGTQITHLPNEIQKLKNLKSLSLSFSGYHHHHNSGHGKKYTPFPEFAMIPRGVISKLTHLEYLRIDVSPDIEWWHNNVDHILAEIVGLKVLLPTLDLYVPKVKLLKLIQNGKSNFRFIVGPHKQRIISRAPPMVEEKFRQSNRSLRFVNGVDIPNELKMFLQFVKAFFLDRHMTINHLSQFPLKNMHLLRLCILAECNEMKSIVDGKDSHNVLPHLEFLTIFYMKNLRSIIGGPSPSDYYFCQLKLLALHTCPKLTTIFTINFLRNLSHLEELIVEDCPKVHSLVSYQPSEQIKGHFLPNLRKLSLVYLPKLVSISDGLYIGGNLERLGFYYCPKLTSLSFKELFSGKLQVIKGEIKWWEALKWSEADWGSQGRPYKFNHIFSPIDEELDVLTQLTTDKVESSTFNDERDLGGSQLEEGEGTLKAETEQAARIDDKLPPLDDSHNDVNKKVPVSPKKTDKSKIKGTRNSVKEEKTKALRGSFGKGKPEVMSRNKKPSPITISRPMVHKSKGEQEEAIRKKMEELLIERQKRIAKRTAASGLSLAVSKKDQIESKTARVSTTSEKNKTQSMKEMNSTFYS